MICQNCGAPNQEGSPVCQRCGAPLPAVQQAAQQPMQQMMMPQPGAQYAPPYPPRRPKPAGGAMTYKMRLNLFGLIGALIFMLCIFMPAFGHRVNTNYSYYEKKNAENLYTSYTLIDSGSLKYMNKSFRDSFGFLDSKTKLFDGSEKYIVMWILDLVISLGAITVAILGIDIGVIVSGSCAFIIGLLTLIFSGADVGGLYSTLEKAYKSYNGSSAKLSDYLEKHDMFSFTIGIAPILMLVSSLVIIAAGIYGFMQKRKRMPRPMYNPGGMMR